MIYTALAVFCSPFLVMQEPATGCMTFAKAFPTEEVCLQNLNEARLLVLAKNKEVGPQRRVQIAHMECVQSRGLQGEQG